MVCAMAEERDLLVVGGGKMGAALVDGLLSSGSARPDQVTVTEIAAGRRADLNAPAGLAGRYPGLRLLDGRLPAAHNAILAVKPGDAQGVCRRLGEAGVGRLLSIAAGVPLRISSPGAPAVPRLYGRCPTWRHWSERAPPPSPPACQPARPISSGRLAS